MEDTKKALESLFDEMLGNIKYFKKKSYHSLLKAFMKGIRNYSPLLPGCARRPKRRTRKG